MRASELESRMISVIAKLRESERGPNPTVYLSEIIESFEAMLRNFDAPQERRAWMAGGVGRLITEDYSFSESALGGEVLKITDEFALF